MIKRSRFTRFNSFNSLCTLIVCIKSVINKRSLIMGMLEGGYPIESGPDTWPLDGRSGVPPFWIWEKKKIDILDNLFPRHKLKYRRHFQVKSKGKKIMQV